MGSLFSKGESATEAARTMGAVRQRDAHERPVNDDQLSRPKKRRKLDKAKLRHDRTIPPPTRAMQNHALNGDSSTHRIATNPSESTVMANAQSETAIETKKRRRKRKVAVFLGYVGENYCGMQMNPGVVTIEQVLLRAFHSAGLISDANKDSLSKVHWMRAARTDKGVSAAGQCVSAKLECEVDKIIDPNLTDLINQHLPFDVQIYGMLRATNGFNARADCHRRRYEYMFPVRLLGGCNGIEAEEEAGKGDPRAAKLTSILKIYEGTHCFANFTEGLTGSDDSARRYMIRVKCGQPFLPPNSGVYYVTVEVYGQSFLLHQIRKMVGLALFVYLGHAPVETIPVALSPNVKVPTPMAPALGLLLDSLIFENYNKRFEATLEKPISSDAFADVKQKFKSQMIYKKIAERERMERILETWLKTCHQKLSYKRDDIREKHAKFVTSDIGKEEQRKAYVASQYPIKTRLDDFLDSERESIKRIAEETRQEFEKRYGTPPTFLCRAPGRVILIGEHLDYNDLPVIGTALTEATFFAGCLDNTNHIEVEHMETGTYRRGRLRVDGLRMADKNREEDGLDSNWLQYVSWGVQGLVELLPQKRIVSGGGRLLVNGDLPRAGGLASSSSLVTASAVAAARLNRKRIPKLQIAEKAAEFERTGAGTRGGAVDHALSMCGVKGCAIQVSFTSGINVKSLRLPQGCSFFAVGSNVKAEKGFDEYVKGQFNLRAAECRVAAAIIARRLHVHLDKSVTTPGQLMFQTRKTSKLQCRDITSLRQKALTVMHEDELLTLEDVRKELDVSEKELRNRFLVDGTEQIFAVGKRMAHVFSEAERVERFERVLDDIGMRDEEKLVELGKILNEGHLSLQKQFDSSCPEVDELVSFCRQSGAIGSRMTGAGWGGFTINLVPKLAIDTFLAQVVARVGKESVIQISPSSGACIFAIHNTYGAPERERKSRLEPDGKT